MSARFVRRTRAIPQDTGLIAFWITTPEDPGGPLGYGVTAWSLEDAYRILDQFGYTQHRSGTPLEVREDVAATDLDQDHVILNAGPLVVRGLWYPFFQLGMPKHRQ